MNAIRQRGTTTVEFAIVGMLLLVLLLVIVEFGRILFSRNVLDESARRAARVAAVCAVNNAAITDAATFVSLPNLTAANVVVQYLDENGTPLGDPAGADLSSIRYVRVRIVNYSFPVATAADRDGVRGARVPMRISSSTQALPAVPVAPKTVTVFLMIHSPLWSRSGPQGPRQ